MKKRILGLALAMLLLFCAAALLRRLNALPQGVDFLLLPTSVRAAYGPCRLHADLHPVYPLLLIVRALAQIQGSH